MNALRQKLGLIALVLAITPAVMAGCSSSDSPTPTATQAAGLPVSFPYVFQGNFTVAGAPGPQDLPIFARLGSGRGPFNNAVRPGEYTNVSIAPQSADDVGGTITFYLGHPDGPNVQAVETYVFSATSQPQFITLNLSFPSLP